MLQKRPTREGGNYCLNGVLPDFLLQLPPQLAAMACHLHSPDPIKLSNLSILQIFLFLSNWKKRGLKLAFNIAMSSSLKSGAAGKGRGLGAGVKVARCQVFKP